MKPDNFMISSKDHKVRILDMGIVMEYIRDGKHKPLGRYGFQGTPIYGSISGLDKYTLNRRDDLESLGYSIMYLIDKESIPWKSNDTKEGIMMLKKDFLVSDSIPACYQCIRDFISEASKLPYDAEPDYDHFETLLKNLSVAYPTPPPSRYHLV